MGASKSTRRFSRTFFAFYHLKCQLLDNMPHPGVILGASAAPPAALELPMSCTGVPGQPRWRHDTEQESERLTEKVPAAPSSSWSQMSFARRLVSRSSSMRGGVTNTTYGMNSSEYTRFIFCGGEEEAKNREEFSQLGSIKRLGSLSLFLKYTLNEITTSASE